MKKAVIPVLLIALLFLLGGCSRLFGNDATEAVTQVTTQAMEDETTVSATEESDSPAHTPSQLPMAAVSVAPVTEISKSDDGTELFSYTYQNMSLTLPDPDVANKVIIDFLNRIDATRSNAEALNASAYANYKTASGWTPYMFRVIYNPMRIDHGVLSLFGNIVSYSGTPHPENSCISASYDLVTGEVLTLGGILTEACTEDKLFSLAAKALSDISREKNLYPDYEDILKNRLSGEWYSDEAFYFSSEGLCFYFSPYEIAPYASGIVTAQIPYDQLTGLLKDAYFPAEQDVYDSNLTAELFENTDLSQFSQFSEIVLHKGAQKMVLHADLPVYDVRLEEGTLTPGSDEFVPSCTVFAVSSLTPGDALMIEAEFATDAPNLRLQYRSGNEIKYAYLSYKDGSILLK